MPRTDFLCLTVAFAKVLRGKSTRKNFSAVRKTPAPTSYKSLTIKTQSGYRQIDLFRILPTPILEKVAGQTRERVLKKDEILFEEGVMERSIYVILSGEILIFRGSKKVAVLRQGEYLGEMSMVDSKPRSAAAKALCDTGVMEIGERVFFDNIAGDPKPHIA